ncbi:hypothetical protein [Lentzea kentuckyensis]|uniref:hypothetical protein n=1 Tax=Lentzea kentuckyensis TaxID=360086 RepID=UPI000A3663B8|nr:hypothetical protein [Lentzea kentuckyensis]
MIPEVERALRGTPTRLAFRALCAAVTRAGAEPGLLAWCEEQLSSWPDETRRAPWSWTAALESGFTKPVWGLVRSLDLRRDHNGLRKLSMPDPRARAEVRAVSHLVLAWYDNEQMAALAEFADHWEQLRSVEFSGLSELNAAALARFASGEAVTRLESLVAVRVWDSLWYFEIPPILIDRPTRLRHAGLRAPDLIHLLRNDLAPDLTSAEVLVASLEEARELAGCPQLAALDRLAIGFRCGRDGKSPLWKSFFGNVIEADDVACEEFFSSAKLTNLRSLTVHGTSLGMGREGLGARGAEAIAGSGVVEQLVELTLKTLPVGDAAIARVLGAVDPAVVEKIVLADLVATDRAASAFNTEFPRLRHLDLSENKLGAEGVRTLLAARMPALEHLDLSGGSGGSPHYSRGDVQPVGDAGAEAVARSGLALKTLNLSATGLTRTGLSAVLELPLETLLVSGNPLGGLPSVPDAVAWRSLRTWRVDDCALGDADIALLPVVAPMLDSLSLSYNNIGSNGARALAEWPVLPQLWELGLHDHVIGDDGLVDLARSRAAQRLLELDLEQDVWTANHRRNSASLPAEVVAEESFPNLDAMFLGVIDGYHGSRSSCGFPAERHEELIRTGRPELVAFLDHVEPHELDPDENPDPDPPSKDFRADRAEKYEKDFTDAVEFARRMLSDDIGWPP